MNGKDDQEYPRAIMHVDGDAFFVSCELTRRPELRGKPVVTGFERGIATALNSEAKALGLIRGMRIRDMRRIAPSVIILPSDYGMYSLYARRMYEIVRKYTDVVEEYSIDECFADLTAVRRPSGQSYEDLARLIRADLNTSLGMTFSVGLGVNKVTAKIASKWKKPDGFTPMPRSTIRTFLANLPIGKVWGIGSSTTNYLRALGITNALDLAMKSRAWVAEYCDRPLAEIYDEFQGQFVKPLELGRDPKSIQHTRSFYPPSRDRTFLWSQISRHVEEACMRLRAQGLVAERASWFVKTQDFDYIRGEVTLSEPLAEPDGILRALKTSFEARYRDHLTYRAAGVSLTGLHPESAGTQTLFAAPKRVGASRAIHAMVDRLARKFGENKIFLGSSFRARKFAGEDHEPDHRKLDVIYMGEVR